MIGWPKKTLSRRHKFVLHTAMVSISSVGHYRKYSRSRVAVSPIKNALLTVYTLGCLGQGNPEKVLTFEILNPIYRAWSHEI